MKAIGLVLLLSASVLGAQGRVVVTDRGPGAGGQVLQSVLARPHRLIEPDSGWYRMPRGEQLAVSLVVLGRTAALEGNVDGDVVVVGGDLFVRPGARIGGRAIAIGGGVYPSALAVVEQGAQSYRDNTYAITRDGDIYRLAYVSLREHASPPLLLPGVFGLRIPTYDRVNGASIPFGPAFTIRDGLVEAHALATYRSDLGKVDPSIRAAAQISRRLRAEAFAGRGTFSNDAWIWSDLVNSFSAFTTGTDTRNHYRADRAEVTVHRSWEWTNVRIEPFLGGRYEDAWTVGPAIGERRGPWSIFGRSDSLGMYRPNPAIQDGAIGSLLSGLRYDYDTDDLRVQAHVRAEATLSAPSDRRFIQATSDILTTFPTFGEQEYALDVHWVTTGGDTPPPQRFAYLGGAGTLVFLDLLEQGGDEALLVDQRYSIPLPRIRVGLLGEPTLLFRHRIGSAGLGGLPDFEQVIGVGVMLTLVRVELQMDPATGELRFSTGFSFSR